MKLPVLLLCLSLLACRKDAASPKEEQLPPATMNGANTFGAMVNGKVWLPKGRPSFFQSNFKVVYDSGYRGGTLSIVAYRQVNDNPVFFEQIAMGMAQVDKEGVYSFDNAELSGIRYDNGICEYDTAPDFYHRGTFEVTKLDLSNGIIAGKFEFTLALPGCDTIRVTEGRFDKKIF